MIKTRGFITLIAILVTFPSISPAQKGSSALVEQQAISVSFDDLLKSPAKYEGKVIRVRGIVQLEFEGNAIFPDASSHEKIVRRIALWIDVPQKLAKGFKSGQYGMIEGVFTAKKHGHMDEYAGELEDITILRPLPSH